MVLTGFIITFEPHWWSSRRGISQIWLQVRETSKIFKKSCAIFWQPAGSYCLNMAISEFVPWNLTTLMLFFHKFFSRMSPTGFFWVTKWRNFTSKNNNAGYSRFVRWKCFKAVLHSSLIFLIILQFFFQFQKSKNLQNWNCKISGSPFLPNFLNQRTFSSQFQKKLKELPVFIKEPAKNWRFTGGSLTLRLSIPLQVKTGSIVFWTTGQGLGWVLWVE